MKASRLFLIPALAVTLIASSRGEIVGYVKTVLKPGLNLISNPLNADNRIKTLFANLPVGTQVFYRVGTNFSAASKDELTETYLPSSAANFEIAPGQGVFI